jgi:hypothetical protein
MLKKSISEKIKVSKIKYFGPFKKFDFSEINKNILNLGSSPSIIKVEQKKLTSLKT